MSDCEFYRELIEQNLLDECSEEEMLILNEHLKECVSCKEEAKFAFNVQNTLRSLPKAQVPDNFLMSLNEKLDLEDSIKTRTPDIRYNRFVNSWKKYSALTACLLLAVLVKINVWNIPDVVKTDDASIDEPNKVTILEASPEVLPEEVLENTPVVAEQNTTVVPAPVVKETVKNPVSENTAQAPISSPVSEKESGKVYVVKASTPHSVTKTPEYIDNTTNVVVLDSSKENRINLDDYKIVVNDKFLETCYVDDVPQNKVIIATPTNINSAKSIPVDTSSLKVPEASNGAGSGSLLVSASDEQAVQEILSKYSLGTRNKTFMLSSENYNSFINELQVNGIKYRDYMIHSGKSNVAFQLIVS